jgi:hypothetical protein
MGFISKNMRNRWDEFDFIPKENEKAEPPIKQEYCCVDLNSHPSFDVVKILESWQEKIKSENPDYSQKEVSAYLAGMIRGIGLQNEL